MTRGQVKQDMAYAQHNRIMGNSNKSLSLAVSVMAHVVLFLVIKPQSFKDLARSASLNFNSGQLIINSIQKEQEKALKQSEVKPLPQKKIKSAKNQSKVIKLPMEQTQTSALSSSNTPEVKTFEKSILTPNITPHYPRIALKRGWQGFVKIQLQVNPDGKVAGVKILEQQAHQSLVDSALEAARQWLFRASPDGRAYLVEKRVIFKIN
ncbi:MAG: energy transducer TonB [Deltaproteobacteria bacterium]|nr:MAG: energy transducer TonB [Deltaproteobacteria bacterium]TNF30506.1 MAG: energy transducer TonB [Deltaproteobacteria bacterium]